MNTLTILLILTVLVVRNSSYLIKVPTEPVLQPDTIAPAGWVHLQKLVLPLFENICEDSVDPVVKRLAQDFSFDVSDGDYSKPDAIINLQNLRSEKGFLPKGEIFTEYNPEHMNELKTVYEVMYYAKNFDTFYKVAAWARQNLNCGLFVNAVYLAIQNRRDTDKLSVPAPYEVIPHYFIQKDVIFQASKLLANETIMPSEGIHEDGNIYTIDANYTAIFYDNDDESKLAYFREDVGLNSYYFLRKLKEAPWFNSDINGRYGENMYQMMKQFMARYDLERYSNGLPELNSVDWNSSFDIPYDPMLIYANGNEFIHRTGPLQLPNNEDIALLHTIENNIGEVVNHMRDGGYNKTQVLNHIMEILVTGDRSYENLARRLLGKDQTDNGYPSVLEHYMTSLRDPMFWIINKKIVEMVDNALQTLPPYSRDELFFPGVEIVNIDIKKMMTVFDYYEFDVSDALKISGDNTTFQVKIGQPRLNHKPFSIKVNVSSLVSSQGLVKIYLGPKVLPGELTMKKNSFVLLDVFEYKFKIGANIITRTSDDMKQFAKDFMSLHTIQKRVQYAEFGLDSLPLSPVNSQFGYPDRLILPKGTFTGLPLQTFVFIAPFVKYNYGVMRSQTDVTFNSAIMSPGYPLDLSIDNKLLLGLPNAMLKDVILTHKGDSKVENYGGSGVTKKWYSTNTYEKEPYDYASKKGQYGNKGKNDFQGVNNGVIYRELDSTENNEGTKETTPKVNYSYLLASYKTGIDYSVKNNEKQASLDYNTNKDNFSMKSNNKQPVYKDKLETVQDKSEILDETENEKPISDGLMDVANPENINKTGPTIHVNPKIPLVSAIAAFDYEEKKKERESKSYNFKPSSQYGRKYDFTKRNYEKFDYNAKKDQYDKRPVNSSSKDSDGINNYEILIPTISTPDDNIKNNEIMNSVKEVINAKENKPKVEHDDDDDSDDDDDDDDDDDILHLAKDMLYNLPISKLH